MLESISSGMNPIKEIFYQIPGTKTLNALYMVRQADRIPTAEDGNDLVVAQLDSQAQKDAQRGFLGFSVAFILGGSLSLIVYDNEPIRQQVIFYSGLLALSEFVDAGLACMIYKYAYGV